MQLQGKESILTSGFLVIVNQFSRFYPINEVLKMKAFGSYFILIPFTFFDRLSNFRSISEVLLLLLQFPLVVQGQALGQAEPCARSTAVTSASTA